MRLIGPSNDCANFRSLKGEDALDLIYHYKPDLVILDIMLPGIDGYEVCEIVRLDPNCRDIKIIFLPRAVK